MEIFNLEKFAQNEKEIKKLYYKLYDNKKDVDKYYNEFLNIVNEMYLKRSNELKNMDKERDGDCTWYMTNNMVGMMLYVDLFNKNLKGLKEKIEYLKNLGITYVHLMPLLKMPKDNNDGGYAVSSYTNIDNKFGDMEEFEEITSLFRKEGISTCIDFVINHTSNEHTWAKKAQKGEKKYMDMYFMFDDKSTTEKYEQTMIEVFPKVSPGNFTWCEECNKYVLTTFYNFQWDLNFSNPFVLNKIIEKILFLANKGVEILRLDAIPYIWKELGTTCRGLSQVHDIVRIYKLVVESVTPSMIFKGEAIVEPNQILSYFGGAEGKECTTMYNASLMTLLWNSLATKNTQLLENSLRKNPELPEKSLWINYVRCHDDIGWGFDEIEVRNLGEDPFLHKQFLINFYNSNYPNSFAKGELYEFDEKTLDARTSGTLASLCGLEKGILELDEYQQELAVKRILLLHSVILSYSGIPVIYSGDEIAQLNDYSYKENPSKANDSRWLHRPMMTWDFNSLHHTQKTVFNKLCKLIKARKEFEIFNSNIKSNFFDTRNRSVLGFTKNNKKDNAILLFNFNNFEEVIPCEAFKEHCLFGMYQDLNQGKKVNVNNNVVLGPYEYLWLYCEN